VVTTRVPRVDDFIIIVWHDAWQQWKMLGNPPGMLGAELGCCTSWVLWYLLGGVMAGCWMGVFLAGLVGWYTRYKS
jgi:hypothetical protein